MVVIELTSTSVGVLINIRAYLLKNKIMNLLKFVN